MLLTDEQRAIIEADFEHSLITAVAGSGKTTTLAHRICYLLHQGHDPRRILVLMFNRAARLDFENKLKKVAGDTFQHLPEIRTYHAMGLRLYRRFIQEGYLRPYAGDVLSEHDLHIQLFNLLRRYTPDNLQDEFKRNKQEYTELSANLLATSKTTLRSVEEVFESLQYAPHHRFLIDIVKRFEEWRKQHARISFADMLFEPVVSLQANSELQKLVGNKIDMTLVDEYQDTNEIQHVLLKYIAGNRARVTVVGDPDQTIYEFRGAQPEYILSRFAEEFANPKEFALSYTFRYGHRVALLVNHLITHNSGRKNVLCRAHHSNPATVVTITHTADETRALLKDIRNQLETGLALTDIAVLMRVWSQAVAVELALLAAQIPYQIAIGKGALANREVNQVIALMELASGRLLEYPFKERLGFFVQLLRFPHIGLKDDSLRELANGLAQQEGYWSDYLLHWMPAHLHALQKRKIRTTAMAWQKLTSGKHTSAHKLANYIKDSELIKSMTELALTYEVAEERIQHVLGMERYLKALKLPPLETLQHFDELEKQAKSQQKSTGLVLTSMHQTKGLEWPCVMIIGLNKQYLPYTMRTQDNLNSHIQSERRLLYVALTRVRERLFLYAPERGHYSAEKEAQQSCFLSNMQLETSQETGRYLDDLLLGHNPTAASVANLQAATENSARQTASSTKIFLPTVKITPIVNRYLKWHNITCHNIACQPPEITGADNSEHVWDSPLVKHVIFGTGKVLEDFGDAFQVEFGDGQRRNFSKKSAHLYFIATDFEPLISGATLRTTP
jgi:DNA helicase II / ATP-dependent DNA helicase PcrA